MFQPRNADSKYPWEREENKFGGKIKIKYEQERRKRTVWNTTEWTPNRVEFSFVGNAFLEELMYAYFPTDSFSIPWEYYPARVTLKGLFEVYLSISFLLFDPVKDIICKYIFRIRSEIYGSWFEPKLEPL